MSIALADTPTLGLLIGLPVGILITVLSFGAAAWGAFLWDDYDKGFVVVPGLLAGIVALAGTCIALWPWKHDYHYWVEKSGTVQAIGKRLVPAGDSGMQEKYVITLNGKPYGVTDTRAALLRVGDQANIVCKKAYEWGSTDHGWDCRWNGGNS